MLALTRQRGTGEQYDSVCEKRFSSYCSPPFIKILRPRHTRASAYHPSGTVLFYHIVFPLSRKTVIPMVDLSYLFLQVEGVNSRSIGKSSSLPASISNISTSFVGTEKNAKLRVGPTKENPGPTLLRVALTAEKPVIRS